MIHRRLHVAEPVTTQMFAAVPPCHNNDMISYVFPLEHAQDDHPRAAFTVVIFKGAITADHTPCIVRCFGEFFGALQFFDERFCLCSGIAWSARDGIL